MKIYSPMFWSLDQGIDYSAPIIQLADIVPRAGQTTFAYFDHHDTLHIGETLQLIWCPPVSDLNGWSEQPSEIAHSYLLQARVVRPVPSSASSMHLSRGKHRFELSVLSRENLLSALRALPEDSGAWHLQHNALTWEELTACGTAVVDGLTYLNASARHEAFMELILEVTEEQIVGFFSLHSDPGGMYQQIGRKRFTGEELRIVRHALDTAHVLHDTQDAYLATGD
ncbi:hypothetical protein EJA70_19680 [Pseudomonas sp. PB103]|uniref:hypothetical protein n=1 Tax=Pseudomonas sp. PB103 TaxID=2494698 RepID=UPI00131B2EB7|nr:hypothetical protein [Pseudomonas sp. PB103]KAE9642234.1 hypothetical protein EJA70_19680 [Pseudomonas sp. PB103]